VGTEKRERQKANRRERQLAEQRAERVSTVKRNVVRGVVLAIAAIAAVVVIAWVGGAFDGDEETTATTPPTTDVATTTTPQFETPEKPEVDPPDEIPTELVVTTLVGGEGPEAAVGDVVTVHYVGIRSEDGLEFDNSYDRGQPFSVQLGVGQVIP
jgi:peptidylprolyl isomerase